MTNSTSFCPMNKIVFHMGELFSAPVSILFFSASYCNDLFYVFSLNQNHQLNWWFASALKGLITGQRLKTHRMVRQSHYFYRPPLKRPVFLCLGILTTCKRVKVLFHRYLIRCNVFLQLVLYVFSNRLRITAYGIHIVPTTPKMSVST